MTPPTDLTGLGVLVTRPSGQADGLLQRLEAVGARTWHHPLLAIAPPTHPAQLDRQLSALASFDWAIIVSPNAARLFAQWLQRHHSSLPPQLRIAWVGKGSARALQSHLGRDSDLLPEGNFDSEGLLACAALQAVAVAGKRVLILRGEGGRELLAETLRTRGAEVEYAELYRRGAPEPIGHDELAGWQAEQGVDIITLTSSETLHHLVALLPETATGWLHATPLLLFSARTRDQARELGFHAPLLLAQEASDAGVVNSLIAWHTGHPEMDNE